MMGMEKLLDGREPGRSKTAYKPKPPFVTVEGIDSPAWERLSCQAVWVLLEFYRKFDGYNRNCLRLSYLECGYKIAGGTFSKAIEELKAYGYLDTKRNGRLQRQNSIYGLSNRWRRIGKNQKKLDRIGKILHRIDKVKRIMAPNGIDDDGRKAFNAKRLRITRMLRYRLGGG